MSNSKTEYDIAVMEGDMNQSEDRYFKARPQIDTGHCRHLFCAGFERGWKARAQNGADLTQLAKSKISQMGGTICGVLVRNEAGALAAVSDLGRVTWLDGADSGEAIHQFQPAGSDDGEWIDCNERDLKIYQRQGRWPTRTLYTKQPANQVPDGWKLVPVEPTTRQLYAAEFPIDNVVSMRQSSQHAIARAAYRAMLNAAPAQPDAGAGQWCRERGHRNLARRGSVCSCQKFTAEKLLERLDKPQPPQGEE